MSLYQARPHDPDGLRELVDQHPVGIDGVCMACRAAECEPRRYALRALAELGLLPRRAPGASRPELIGARRITPEPS